jgi:hydrogenase maturation factor
LDPLYLANEGKLIAICPADEAERLLEVMKSHPLGRHGEIIGKVTEVTQKGGLSQVLLYRSKELLGVGG